MSGYVYLIGSTVFGWYKIGKAKTPEVRVKDLGILLPFKINVIGVWKANDHHLMESALHEMYQNNRINGEWFEFSLPQMKEMFNSIPSETRIYPIDDVEHVFDNFSNIEEDKRKNKKVIGVRTQKLRGNFTPEEREQKRLAAIAIAKENKDKGLSLKGNLKTK